LDRIINHTMFESAIDLTSDGNAEMGNAAHEIGGAVDGVDDPDRARIAAAAPGFLGANSMGGIGAVYNVYNGRVGAFVHFADIISFVFALDFARLAATIIRQNNTAGAACGGYRDIGEGLHGGRYLGWAAWKAYSLTFARVI